MLSIDIEKETSWVKNRAETKDYTDPLQGIWYSRDGRIEYEFVSYPSPQDAFIIYDELIITDLDELEYQLSQGYQIGRTPTRYKTINSEYILITSGSGPYEGYSFRNGKSYGGMTVFDQPYYIYRYESMDDQIALHAVDDIAPELGENVLLFRSPN